MSFSQCNGLTVALSKSQRSSPQTVNVEAALRASTHGLDQTTVQLKPRAPVSTPEFTLPQTSHTLTAKAT
ncbi:uncharacterized, partial [Tachysurus ichikawai]